MHTQNFAKLSHKKQIQKDYCAGENNANRTLRYSSKCHAHIHQPITLVQETQERTSHKEEQRRIRNCSLTHIKEHNAARKHHRRPEASFLVEQLGNRKIQHQRCTACHQTCREACCKFAVTKNVESQSYQPIVHGGFIVPVVTKNTRRQIIPCQNHFASSLCINGFVRIQQRHATNSEEYHKNYYRR